MVSRELEKECIVVFDEAHNIDNVCIEVIHSVESLLQHGETRLLRPPSLLQAARMDHMQATMRELVRPE